MGMSIEEVIDIIKDRIKEQRIDVALNAIDKQVPKNVVCFSNNKYDDLHIWQCPCCKAKSIYYRPINFCSECGQALKFEEVLQ